MYDTGNLLVDQKSGKHLRLLLEIIVCYRHKELISLHTDKLLHISYHISVYSTFNVWNDCNYRGLPSNQQFSLLISYLILVSCLYNDLLYLIHKLRSDVPSPVDDVGNCSYGHPCHIRNLFYCNL